MLPFDAVFLSLYFIPIVDEKFHILKVKAPLIFKKSKLMWRSSLNILIINQNRTSLLLCMLENISEIIRDLPFHLRNSKADWEIILICTYRPNFDFLEDPGASEPVKRSYRRLGTSNHVQNNLKYTYKPNFDSICALVASDLKNSNTGG